MSRLRLVGLSVSLAGAILTLAVGGSANASGGPYALAAASPVLFADGFETGDAVLWEFDAWVELPYGTIDQTLAVRFAPVDPRTDLVLSIDTTGSMTGPISALRTGFTATIVPAALAMVPDTAFGVGSWRDFPVSTFGDSGDLPWLLGQAVTTSSSLANTTLNGLAAAGGGDTPESGYEALYQIGTGSGVSWTGGSVPAYGGAGLGGVGFRSGSLPIAVHITDAPSHLETDYGTSVPNAHSKSAAFSALNALGARVPSLLASTDATANAQLRELATSTGAEVLPCAFVHGAGCAAGQCCTGLSGAGETPNASGRCPLRFLISSFGNGTSNAIVAAMSILVEYGIHAVVASAADDVSPSTLDTTCFIDRVEASGFVRPPQEPAASCVGEAAPADLGGVGYNNGFTNLATGSVGGSVGSALTFVVHASNLCASQTTAAQVFAVSLDLRDTVTGELMDHLDLSVVVPRSP